MRLSATPFDVGRHYCISPSGATRKRRAWLTELNDDLDDSQVELLEEISSTITETFTQLHTTWVDEVIQAVTMATKIKSERYIQVLAEFARAIPWSIDQTRLSEPAISKIVTGVCEKLLGENARRTVAPVPIQQLCRDCRQPFLPIPCTRNPLSMTQWCLSCKQQTVGSLIRPSTPIEFPEIVETITHIPTTEFKQDMKGFTNSLLSRKCAKIQQKFESQIFFRRVADQLKPRLSKVKPNWSYRVRAHFRSLPHLLTSASTLCLAPEPRRGLQRLYKRIRNDILDAIANFRLRKPPSNPARKQTNMTAEDIKILQDILDHFRTIFPTDTCSLIQTQL